MDALQAYAKKSIATNYTVSSDKVTEIQITEAQTVLTNLIQFVTKGIKAKDINDKLLHLYHIIPRQMANVKSHLFEDINTQMELDSATKRLQNEQDILDVMAGQVALNKASKPTDAAISKNKTLLEALGLKVVLVTDSKEVSSIKEMMGDQGKQLSKVFKVVNIKTQTTFDNHLAKTTNKQCKLLWHGSRNCNWLNILSTGLLIRPAGVTHTGSMFGNSIYMSDKFKKSYGYTSATNSYWVKGSSSVAYLALYNCHVGKQKHIYKHDSSCSRLNLKQLQNEGFDSLFAHSGVDLKNNEFCFYNPNQVTIQYLVEVIA